MTRQEITIGIVITTILWLAWVAVMWYNYNESKIKDETNSIYQDLKTWVWNVKTMDNTDLVSIESVYNNWKFLGKKGVGEYSFNTNNWWIVKYDWILDYIDIPLSNLKDKEILPLIWTTLDLFDECGSDFVNTTVSKNSNNVICKWLIEKPFIIYVFKDWNIARNFKDKYFNKDNTRLIDIDNWGNTFAVGLVISYNNVTFKSDDTDTTTISFSNSGSNNTWNNNTPVVLSWIFSTTMPNDLNIYAVSPTPDQLVFNNFETKTITLKLRNPAWVGNNWVYSITSMDWVLNWVPNQNIDGNYSDNEQISFTFQATTPFSNWNNGKITIAVFDWNSNVKEIDIPIISN